MQPTGTCTHATGYTAPRCMQLRSMAMHMSDPYLPQFMSRALGWLCFSRLSYLQKLLSKLGGQVIHVLAASGSNVNAIDFRKQTPLHLAAQEGRLQAVRMLVRLGADLEKRDALGLTAIDVAERNWRKAVYAFLEDCMGEKCVYDRRGDSGFYCGKRHPDKVAPRRRSGPVDAS